MNGDIGLLPKRLHVGVERFIFQRVRIALQHFAAGILLESEFRHVYPSRGRLTAGRRFVLGNCQIVFNKRHF